MPGKLVEISGGLIRCQRFDVERIGDGFVRDAFGQGIDEPFFGRIAEKNNAADFSFPPGFKCMPQKVAKAVDFDFLGIVYDQYRWRAHVQQYSLPPVEVSEGLDLFTVFSGLEKDVAGAPLPLEGVEKLIEKGGFSASFFTDDEIQTVVSVCKIHEHLQADRQILVAV